jgi:hypothetical protein
MWTFENALNLTIDSLPSSPIILRQIESVLFQNLYKRNIDFKYREESWERLRKQIKTTKLEYNFLAQNILLAIEIYKRNGYKNTLLTSLSGKEFELE